MPATRPTIIIAGAGIGGLTASLALAAKGYRIVVVEQAERLEEAGAGLQLSPNASRILIGLGLEPAISTHALVPEAVSIMSGPRGIELSRLPLTGAASSAANAPYWVVHRADLQAALVAQANDHPDIELRLGTAFKDVANDEAGVVIGYGDGSPYRQEHAAALIGADGIWSSVRRQIFPDIKPGFSGRIAWRGIVDTERVHADPAPRCVQLWMGANAHLVIYPVTGGRQLNVVAITSGQWREPGWSAPAEAREVLTQFTAPQWSETARAIVQAVPQWRKWALFTLPQQIEWTSGPTALLGDAAHAMLPFAAQGAGMAIEDAAVLASCLDGRSTDIPAALRRYADLRQARVKRVQQTAEQNGRIYHLSGPFAAARNLAMRAMGGPRLLARQNWIYDWRE